MEGLITASAGHVASALQKVDQNDISGAAGEYAKAADSLTSALVEVLAAQTRMLLDADEVESACASGRRATAADPEAATAWYWHGMALLRASHAPGATTAFEKAVSLEKSAATKAQYSDWVSKAKLAGGDSIRGAARETGTSGPLSSGTRESLLAAETEGTSARTRSVDAPAVVPPLATAPRMEWYQSAAVVTVDVYAKQVDVTASKVDISERRLFVRLVRPGKDDYILERDLFGPVVVAESTWSANKFKAEIKLKKAAGSGEWKSLAASGQDSSATEQARIAGEERARASARRQKNWDAIAEEELKDTEEKDPMALFKTLYADGDEDSRRAMMKSYQESGGKVLSTNWSDVGSRKVEYKETD